MANKKERLIYVHEIKRGLEKGRKIFKHKDINIIMDYIQELKRVTHKSYIISKT